MCVELKRKLKKLCIVCSVDFKNKLKELCIVCKNNFKAFK